MPSSSDAIAPPTSQADVENGVVNVVIGVAPLVPSEFVILSIQLRAGRNAGGG